MKYHNITKDDMLNGDGIRVVLWVAGCEHHCKGCQNPVTWNPDDGLEFDEAALHEIYSELSKEHVKGITFSGGDPLHPQNRFPVFHIIQDVKEKFPNKDVWIYTGYTWEEVLADAEMHFVIEGADVLVDGRFNEDLLDKNYHWAGSTNQRVVDIKKSLQKGMVILHESNQERRNTGTVQCRKDCQCS